MSLFARYVQHPAPGGGGLSDLPATGNPLGAGRMTIWASNATHLGEQNAVRALRQHPGLREFFAASTRPGGLTTAPDVRDIPWSTSQKDGAGCIDLGMHYVWRRPDGRWPKLKLTFAGKIDGANTLGWCLAISPGTAGPWEASASVSGTIASSSWTAASASIELDGARDLRPVVVSPGDGVDEPALAERGRLLVFRAFFGCYCSSGTDAGGQRASVTALSLRLEAP
ncbi:MAG TPA: hypothetical protein VFV33_27035 [Gemmatimonadaceae bacterium]|nr:hypothetical protein [Gemmatimonadaceae bacterium]